MYTDNTKKSTLKYRAAHCDRITIETPRGEKSRYKAHAERIGKPLRRLIMDLIDEDIKRVDAETGVPLVVPAPDGAEISESR